MIERIEAYYGKELGSEEKRWAEQNLGGLTGDYQDKFMDTLGNICKKGKGCPDISSMSKALQAVTGKAPRVYFWSVCLECGTGYDYRLEMCPKCYEKGLKCTDKEVKVSDFPPPMNVIRYNKTFLRYTNEKGQREMSCYNCEGREFSYCSNFGNPNWDCRDYRNCKCNACCSMERRANSKLKEQKGEKHYAVPLRAVG